MSKSYKWIIPEFDEEWIVRAGTMRDSRNRMTDIILEDFNKDLNELEFRWNEHKGFGYVLFNNFPVNGIWLAG